MKRIILCVCVLALCFSCSEDESTTTALPDSNFYGLAVGNSWVYKNYRYNMGSDSYEDTGVIDSLSVIGTEVINANTYYKIRRYTTGNDENITYCNPNGEHFELLRDSVGYLIWETGQIKFVHNNFNERLISEESWGSIMETLQEGESELTVEAGTFNSVHSERYVVLSNGEQAQSIDRFYYSDGIGLIYDTSSFVSQDVPVIIRRLDSYVVQ